MMEPTRVTASRKYQDKFADFELLTTGLEVSETVWVEKNETVSQAIDRVFDLVDKKLTEKIIQGRKDLG